MSSLLLSTIPLIIVVAIIVALLVYLYRMTGPPISEKELNRLLKLRDKKYQEWKRKNG
ncbi:hypothetical protein LCGC14_1711140 [marine sediment metagenome]|uniref:Uncharacterized protein n=1 Tax=marine sediment metagenome TaxID=412755 RepID=A0A0F9HFP2_9ZZZZ